VLPGLQAAFVDIGTEKSAFLHASDLVYPDAGGDDDDDDGEESFHEPSRDEREAPPIQDVLKKGQELLVQVSKEPISTKGPRVTAQVSMAGRFLVYMPFASRVGVSRKIGDREERKRLRALVEGMLPDDSGGVIVRTVGEDVTPETIERELQTLMNGWKRIKKKTHFVRPPSLVHRETSLTRGLIRDIFSDKVERVTVDSKQVYNEIVEYLKGIAPELMERIVLYEGTAPLFDTADVEGEIRDLFKRRCDLPSGGYLIIEPTEALISIDVNSGRFVGKKDPDKSYPTLAAAAQAVHDFIKAGGLPPASATVRSGGGLHVYWISDRPLTPEEWRPFAFGLKALAQAHKLKNDLGVIADSARVLRVPGTFNMKQAAPRPVRLLTLEKDYNFAVDLKQVAGLVPAVSNPVANWYAGQDPLPARPAAAFHGEPIESLSEGIKAEFPPRDLESAKGECGGHHRRHTASAIVSQVGQPVPKHAPHQTEIFVEPTRCLTFRACRR
jgi:Rne/Rng family ribonuclease